MNTAISKIFKTILIMFIIITIYTIPISQKNNNNILRTNLEISEITGINTNKVYLLNKDNLLVQTEMFNDAKEEKQIKNIINYLTITNNKTPKGLKSYIPKNANLQSIKKENNNLFIDFSKELLESDNIDLIIKGIVYSLIDISGIENIHLTVDKKTITGYSNPINKNIGINEEYLYSDRRNIKKVVVYYLDNEYNDLYFVPVTKYLNDNREKVNIIIEELKKSENMISLINEKLELISYNEEKNAMYLNFNEYLLDKNNKTNELIKQTIAYTIFDNFDVNIVMFEVNNEQIGYIKRYP